MTNAATWFAPDGQTVTFDADGPYKLLDISEISSTRVGPQSDKAPGQYGETLVGVRVDPRVVVLQAHIKATDLDDLWTKRNTLAKAFAFRISDAGEDQETGTLRVSRANAEALELAAVPIDSPKVDAITPRLASADIELWCPYPYWLETADRFAQLQGEGGFEFLTSGFEFETTGFEFESMNQEVEVDNQGDVPRPIFARLFGEVTNPRLGIVGGEHIRFEVELLSGDYIEFRTDFGRKYATLVRADGSSENAIPFLDLTGGSTFWQLPKGVSTIRFSADVNTSGEGRMWWRQALAGI